MSRGYNYHRKRITHAQQRRLEKWNILALLLVGGSILGGVFYLIAAR